jgi:hypothetical protein
MIINKVRRGGINIEKNKNIFLKPFGVVLDFLDHINHQNKARRADINIDNQ